MPSIVNLFAYANNLKGDQDYTSTLLPNDHEVRLLFAIIITIMLAVNVLHKACFKDTLKEHSLSILRWNLKHISTPSNFCVRRPTRTSTTGDPLMTASLTLKESYD